MKKITILLLIAAGLTACAIIDRVRTPLTKSDSTAPSASNIPPPGTRQPQYTEVKYDANPNNVNYIIQSIFSGQNIFTPNEVYFLNANIKPNRLVAQNTYADTVANEKYLKSIFGGYVNPAGFTLICSTITDVLGQISRNYLFSVFESGELLGIEVRKDIHPWSTTCRERFYTPVAAPAPEKAKRKVKEPARKKIIARKKTQNISKKTKKIIPVEKNTQEETIPGMIDPSSNIEDVL